MEQAGAMVTCSLIQPDLDVADRFLFVQDFFSSLAGGLTFVDLY